MNNYSNRKTPNSKVPQRATRKTLDNAALHYLRRFASSRANFSRVLMRRVRRSAKYHDTSIDEGASIVEALTQHYTKIGVLDDKRFAEAQLRSYSYKGISLRVIRIKLVNKGVPAGVIDEVLKLETQENSNLDLEAAIIFSKKRKLGPFRQPSKPKMKNRNGDLAKLSRAGFEYRIAKKIALAKSIEELEETVETELRV